MRQLHRHGGVSTERRFHRSGLGETGGVSAGHDGGRKARMQGLLGAIFLRGRLLLRGGSGELRSSHSSLRQVRTDAPPDRAGHMDPDGVEGVESSCA